MTNKNIQMKKREGNDWDNLFPISTTENIYDLNGIQVETILSENRETITSLKNDVVNRGVNVLYPPEPYVACVGDGVTDDTEALQTLIDDFSVVVLPNRVYAISDTIYLRNRSKNLIGSFVPNGMSIEVSGNLNGARLLYTGATNRQKAMVVMGQNDVNEEPTIDSSGLVLENIILDGQEKIGFGVYGTYLTNESTVKNVIATGTLEYGMYFARSWYAKFYELLARHNIGKGLSFGLPIEYQNGNTINWSTNAPIEMNNTPIRDIRAHSNGKHYSVDNPNTFRITNESMRTKGFGIGLGVGSGFSCDGFTSEANGGVNLYVYSNGGSPTKTITKGYIENAMNGSGVAPEEKTNILIEHSTEVMTSPYEIRDIYMHYNSGGIHFTGGNRMKVWLRNIHQPRFLKSLDDHTDEELYAMVLKENVYSQAGGHNTLPSLAIGSHYEMDMNTRYSWDFQVNRVHNGMHLVYAKLSDGSTVQPTSSIRVTDLDGGTTQNFGYTSLSSEWKLIRTQNGRFNQFSFAGSGGDVNAPVDIKIISMPSTIE